MLTDKVIVVTGGAGRIGSAFIRAITSQNGVGVIAEIDTKRANLLKDEITSSQKDSRIEVLQIDISDANSINEAINFLHSKYGNTSQNFIKYFLEQGHGNIINISSIQGIGAPAFETYEGTNMHSPIEYTVVKHGLLGMTKYMAKMFKKDNIRVNAISPGGILDEQPEPFLSQYKKRCGMKGMLDANDICGTLIYLLSDVSKYVNGQNIVVDDGFSL